MDRPTEMLSPVTADAFANVTPSPSAPDEPTAALIARFEHAASQVAFWQAMQQQIQKDRGHLRFVLPVGAVIAAALYFSLPDHRIALGVGAVAVSAWLMGLYFTRVRQEEYSYNLHDARQALDAARAALPVTALANDQSSEKR